jgi:lipid II:glycine glycyltransferase (peptidoglycan interpeptide bridge formation enzyme)
MFAMDIASRTPDEVLADFKRNTRNHVRKAERAGVKIRELTREELPLFKQITESTSERRHFSDRPLSYYEQMYDLFHEKGQVKFLVAEVDSRILSAAMFMLYGDEIVYLFSGSDEKYMKEYNAQYLIQWHIIKYAAEHGFKRYNFYGISGLPKNGDLDGIYEFKKGFDTKHGKVLEYIGTFELPVDKALYHFHRMLSRIKH